MVWYLRSSLRLSLVRYSSVVSWYPSKVVLQFLFQETNYYIPHSKILPWMWMWGWVGVWVYECIFSPILSLYDMHILCEMSHLCQLVKWNIFTCVHVLAVWFFDIIWGITYARLCIKNFFSNCIITIIHM